jgi:signal transduction histidine kinase
MRRRQRTALNEALHELRRPLQALALAGPEPSAAIAAGAEHSLLMAASALARLDREINGGAAERVLEALELGVLLEESAQRWERRAALAGSTLVCRPGPAVDRGERVNGERWALAQALDNLILNAIEHGGPRIVAATEVFNGRLRVSVRDCGRPLATPDAPGHVRSGLGDRIRGRARHGHGLRVVRRVASAHGGRFSLRRFPGGAEALLELPRAGLT